MLVLVCHRLLLLSSSSSSSSVSPLCRESTHIPETNHVPREHSVAAVLVLLFMVRISLVPALTPLYLYVSTFRSMCSVPNMAVFCSSLTSWLPGMLLTYYYYYYYYHHHHNSMYVESARIWARVDTTCSRAIKVYARCKWITRTDNSSLFLTTQLLVVNCTEIWTLLSEWTRSTSPPYQQDRFKSQRDHIGCSHRFFMRDVSFWVGLPVQRVEQNDLRDWESDLLSLVFTKEATHASNLTGLSIGFRISMCFCKRFIAQIEYTLCTRINYKIVPLTNLNKYLHYCTSRSE
jgi:hypothetical protein